MASRKCRLADFTEYPKLVKRWAQCGDAYLKNHPNTTTAQRYKDGWEMFYNNVFCDKYEDFLSAKGGLFGDADFKQLLYDYFKIEG